MRLSHFSVFLFAQCAIFENISCLQIKRSAKVAQSQESHSRLEVIALRLENKIELFENKIENKLEKILNHLEAFENKVTKINDNIFSETISDDVTQPIKSQLVLWNEKISELDHKLTQLINQSDERFYDTKSGPDNELIQLRVPENERPSDFEAIFHKFNETLENIRAENRSSAKLENLREYLQNIFGEAALKNSTHLNDRFMQILRKERKIAENTNLITEILTMVKNELKSKGGDGENVSESTGSMTIVSNFENMKASTLSQRIKTTASPRKDRIIFPNVKNKPVKTNMTLTSETLDIKDFKGFSRFSCVDLMNAGIRQSGVYYLQIRGTTYWFLKVFCEQEIADGGWTVIQRRDDFGEPRENFNRDWADYKNGFGDPAKEFWMGNENIYMLTNNEDYALRIELEDFEGNKRYAQYSHFKIHSEADYYKLEIDGYEGNAGDSLNDPWYGSNNSPFSTYNRDNDRSSLNCASMLKGGWWWKSCGRGLNGLYLHDPQDITARQGIVWFRWRGWDYTLKKATMMIKPFVKPLNTVPTTTSS